MIFCNPRFIPSYVYHIIVLYHLYIILNIFYNWHSVSHILHLLHQEFLETKTASYQHCCAQWSKKNEKPFATSTSPTTAMRYSFFGFDCERFCCDPTFKPDHHCWGRLHNSDCCCRPWRIAYIIIITKVSNSNSNRCSFMLWITMRRESITAGKGTFMWLFMSSFCCL